MAYVLSPIQIIPGAAAVPYIDIKDAAGNHLDGLIKTNIQHVNYTFTANPGSVYGYPTMTRLTITMIHGGEFEVELQNVTNQATWNTGTESAANTAVTDILASL